MALARQAAEADHLPARFTLAGACLEGFGLDPEPVEARRRGSRHPDAICRFFLTLPAAPGSAPQAGPSAANQSAMMRR
jgi:hypothetical protein